MRKYELATSIHLKYDQSGKIPLEQVIERIYKCGFTNLDFNFLDMCIHPDSFFLKDDYLDKIKQCRAFTDSLGAKFVQAHAPCESVYDKQDYDLLVSLCIRAIESCAILDIPWMVYHTTFARRFNLIGDNFEFNRKFFGTLLPYARKYGVGIAIENGVPMIHGSGRPVGELTEELIDFVDSFDDELVGVCWDFGHANECAAIEDAGEIAHQSVQLKKLGDRLKCTHVHDNNAKKVGSVYKLPQLPEERLYHSISPFCDEHIAPFSGDIDWADVICGLDAIDYSHYFTFEAHNAVNKLPDSVADGAIRQLYDIGQAILAMSGINGSSD